MFRHLFGISLLCSHHWCQLAAVKKTRVQADNLGFLGRQFGKIDFFYKFLGGVFSGNTCKKSAGVYKASPWYLLEVTCTVPTICLQCCFLMVYVPAIYLWFCKSLSFGCIWVINFVLIYTCIYEHKNIFEYKNIFYRGMGWAWVNQHSMHLHIVTLSKMLHLGWSLPYIENTSWIAYISLQWQL